MLTTALEHFKRQDNITPDKLDAEFVIQLEGYAELVLANTLTIEKPPRPGFELEVLVKFLNTEQTYHTWDTPFSYEFYNIAQHYFSMYQFMVQQGIDTPEDLHALNTEIIIFWNLLSLRSIAEIDHLDLLYELKRSPTKLYIEILDLIPTYRILELIEKILNNSVAIEDARLQVLFSRVIKAVKLLCTSPLYRMHNRVDERELGQNYLYQLVALLLKAQNFKLLEFLISELQNPYIKIDLAIIAAVIEENDVHKENFNSFRQSISPVQLEEARNYLRNLRLQASKQKPGFDAPIYWRKKIPEEVYALQLDASNTCQVDAFLPFTMRQMLTKYDDMEKVRKFIRAYNTYDGTENKLRFMLLMQQYMSSILIIVHIMKADAFVFMQQLLEEDESSLKSLLENLYYLPKSLFDILKNLFQRFKSHVSEQKDKSFRMLLEHESFLLPGVVSLSESQLTSLAIEQQKCQSIADFYLEIQNATSFNIARFYCVPKDMSVSAASQFVRHIFNVNLNATKDRKISLKEFFMKFRFDFYFHIMGDEAFAFLQSFCENSVEMVHKTLSNVFLSRRQQATCKKLFFRFREDIATNTTNKILWKNILFIFNIIHSFEKNFKRNNEHDFSFKIMFEQYKKIIRDCNGVTSLKDYYIVLKQFLPDLLICCLQNIKNHQNFYQSIDFILNYFLSTPLINFEKLNTPKNSFNSFLMKVTKTNSQADVEKKLSLREFFYSKPFSLLVSIMSTHVFAFLHPMCKNAYIQLYKFLSAIYEQDWTQKNIDICKILFERFRNHILTNDQDYQTWKNILIAFGLVNRINYENSAQYNADKSNYFILLECVNDYHSLQAYYENMCQHLAHCIVDKLPISNKQDCTAVLLQKVPVCYFPWLLEAIKHMRDGNELYSELFQSMLGAYLTSGNAFNDFTLVQSPNADANDPVRQLVQHNQAIIKRLQQYGIDTKLAFDYRARLSFEYSGGLEVSIESRLPAIWRALQLVKTKAQELKLNVSSVILEYGEEIPREVSALNKELEILNNLIVALETLLFGQQDEHPIFTEEQFLQIAHKIYDNQKVIEQTKKVIHQIQRLKSLLPGEVINIDVDNEGAQTSKRLLNERQYLQKLQNQLLLFYKQHSDTESEMRRIIEHSEHFIDYWNHLNQDLKKIGGHQKIATTKTKSFHVEAWDKKQIQTLFLGNWLDCCLATNRAHFENMVIRMLDSGMFMHVVIDDETGLPVCGNWLFWGESFDDPRQIVVVANFFEINTTYAANQLLISTLVDHLLYFTGKFAVQVGAKAFVLRPLTYGNIPDFQQFGACQHYPIKKVGGYIGEHEGNIILQMLNDVMYNHNVNHLIVQTSEMIDKYAQSDKITIAPQIMAQIFILFSALQELKAIPPDSVNKYDLAITSYDQIKICVFQILTSATEDIDENSALIVDLRRLIKDTNSWIITHEDIFRELFESYYYLDAVNIPKMYLYDEQALTTKSSILFSPSCKTQWVEHDSLLHFTTKAFQVTA